jgi:hypothetical protein
LRTGFIWLAIAVRHLNVFSIDTPLHYADV